MTAGDVVLTCGAVVVGATFAAGFAMMIRNALASEFQMRTDLREIGKARRENRERGVESELASSGIPTEERTSLDSRSSQVERNPSHAPKEDQKTAGGAGDKKVSQQEGKREPDLKELVVADALPISFVLLVCSLTLACFGVYRFLDGQTYAGFKFIGFSIIVLGGCFDPINFLWLCLPFTFSHVVASPRHARFTLPLISIGWILLIVGWVGDGWLFHPPFTNPDSLPSSP